MHGTSGPSRAPPVARLATALRSWLARPAARRQLVLGAGALATLVVAYQLGQVRAGYNALSASLTERRLSRDLGELRDEYRRVSERLTRLQTDEQVNREAYARVEKQLAELQDQLIEQQSEVAFYRGIVGASAEGALRVREFELRPAAQGAVRLRFVLARAGPAEREVRGQLQVRVEGRRGERPESVDGAAAGALPRSFALRYFQEISAELRLPDGFTPERVVIRTAPSGAGLRPGVESFPWSVPGA